LDFSLHTAGEESIQPLSISTIEQLLSATKLKEWVLAFVENLDLVLKLWKEEMALEVQEQQQQQQLQLQWSVVVSSCWFLFC
jgi:hypothetical protein